jgi:hypothetical protein
MLFTQHESIEVVELVADRGAGAFPSRRQLWLPLQGGRARSIVTGLATLMSNLAPVRASDETLANPQRLPSRKRSGQARHQR